MRVYAADIPSWAYKPPVVASPTSRVPSLVRLFASCSAVSLLSMVSVCPVEIPGLVPVPVRMSEPMKVN